MRKWWDFVFQSFACKGAPPPTPSPRPCPLATWSSGSCLFCGFF